MDSDTQDMIHVRDTLFNKFEREEIKAKKDIFTIDEILECVKLQINDEENYKKIERDIIRVLLLDAITNNGDRHALNWALVRNISNNDYSLAVFDHASSFMNMFKYRGIETDEWIASYTTFGKDKERRDIGSNGKYVIECISKEYPEYFEEFCKEFESKLPQILDCVEKEKMDIDFTFFVNKIKYKERFLEKIRNRKDMEYYYE